LPEYCEIVFADPFLRLEIENRAKSSAGHKRISISDVKEMVIPLPPLEEQKEIVRQVDKLFALADKVEAHYQKAKARVDKLSQSVLAKAFRGELVPQDPNDEPAEKLLERILEEKAKLVGSKPSAGGRKKKAMGRKPSIADPGLPTANAERPTADCKLLTANCPLQTAD
jgi:type I restriction enzyme S subunit